jgi:hypothetical protein
MAKSYSKEWPVLPYEEGTQSNTYLPLICSVIDGFNVDFPYGYVDVFLKATQTYNKTGLPILFHNFEEFQEYLKRRLRVVPLNRHNFFKNCDDPDNYHVLSYVQEEIMEDLDGFFNLFIPMLMQFARDKHTLFKSKADSLLTCILKDTHHKDYASGEAARLAEADAADAPRKAAHAKRLEEAVAHKAASAKRLEAEREHAHGTVTDKWYAMGDGVQEDYSDEVNRQINEHLGSDEPPFMTNINGHTYLIDTKHSTEENLKTGQTRLILKKPRWYYTNDLKQKIPYSDHVNDTLIDAYSKREGVIETIRGKKYYIIPATNSQVNMETGKSRPIVYEGGKTKNKKTKRRRSLCKYTRHRY